MTTSNVKTIFTNLEINNLEKKISNLRIEIEEICKSLKDLKDQAKTEREKGLGEPKQPEDVKSISPLLSPPSFIIRKNLEIEDTDDCSVKCVRLGNVHNYIAKIIKYQDNTAHFHWGCAVVGSERNAHDHWRNGRSMESDEPRPHSEELIQFVSAICKYNGWKW